MPQRPAASPRGAADGRHDVVPVERCWADRGLVDGSHEPQPVRGVKIPKPAGGVPQVGHRNGGGPPGATGDRTGIYPAHRPDVLGIPLRVPPRSQLTPSCACLAEGRGIMVDIDRKKFVDVMQVRGWRGTFQINGSCGSCGASRKRAGRRGCACAGIEGTPQGSPLSPLLGEPVAGRLGPGAGTTRALLPPVCQRRHCLRAVAGSQRTRAGEPGGLPEREASPVRMTSTDVRGDMRGCAWLRGRPGWRTVAL